MLLDHRFDFCNIVKVDSFPFLPLAHPGVIFNPTFLPYIEPSYQSKDCLIINENVRFPY